MAVDGTVKIIIQADGKDAVRTVDQVKGSLRGLDGAGESAGKSAGMKIGTGLKIAGAAVAAAAVGIGKIVSSSLTEGADLQQSLGGIETLFKSSADKVKKYASQSFKTTGLSANEYMTNVTSFSASLISSLGGDTAKAANIANMAMVDMADNSNKMGTNMQDIQNAYQGFAKQNYTMLDNLKLGYGGTQQEMQRLLKDATKITGVKYNIKNLSDVYSAIHAIQNKLDITGTTAKEAASTFSGSFNAMKAALKDLQGNMALGMDIGPALQNLATTASTFLFKNFIPMVGNVLKALPGAITGFLSVAGPSFKAGGVNLINQLVSGMNGGRATVSSALDSIGASINSFSSVIKTAFKSAFDALSPVITASLGTILGQLPAMFTTVVNSITPIIAMIGTAFSQLDFSGIQMLVAAIIPAITAGFNTMMGIVGPAISSVVSSFVALWNATQPLISVLAGALMPAFQVIGAFLGGVFKSILTGVSMAFDAIRVVIGILTPIITALVNAFRACTPVLTTVANWIGQLSGLFGNLGGAGKVLKSVISNSFNGIKSAVQTAGSGIKASGEIIKSIWSALKSAGSALRSALSAVWSGIKATVSSAGSGIKVASNGIKAAWVALKASASAMKAGVSAAWAGVTGAVRVAKATIAGIVGSIKSIFAGLGNINLSSAGHAIMNGFLGGLKSAFENVKSFVGGIAGWIKDHKGPISYDKRLLIPAGHAIMGGFDDSLVAGFKSVQTTVSGMGDRLSLAMTPQLAFPGAETLVGGTLNVPASSSNAVYNTYNTTNNSTSSANSEALELLRTIASKQTTIDGSSFASAYEQYGSTETARRNQLKGRGLAIGNKF